MPATAPAAPDLDDFLSPASFWMPERIVQSAWLEHAPFAFWLMGALRPARLVELGTHHGFSYLAFCQAVRALDLPTRCFAVDSWTGDTQSGLYADTVYETLAAYHDPRYGGFSRLLRTRFNAAAPAFQPASIDLLHIDGQHDYDSVRGDYELWAPRLSEQGVVLFHDIGVRSAGFGVWRLWEELARGHPHFAFHHGYGLGVLAHGPRSPEPVARFLAAGRRHGEAIRQCYQRLGAAIGDRQAHTVPAAPRGARLHIHLAALAPEFSEARTVLPLDALAAAPGVSVSQSRRRIDLPRLPPGLPKVLVLQRLAPIAAVEWEGSLSAFLGQGWIVVSELDDHPALIAAVHGQPVDVRSWNPVRLVHAVQTSTAPLCEAIRHHNPEAIVFENAAFSHVADAVAPRPDGGLRVFHGAFNRGALSARLAASVAPVAAARPGIEFVVVHDRAFFDALGDVRKSFSPALPYARYHDLMGTCDVALMPLEEGATQACKSDIKFVEASSRGLASIVSPTAYARTVRHRETGLIAADMAAWADGLACLHDYPALRCTLARGALRYVARERMFALQVERRITWYEGLWARRHALTEAMTRRLDASLPNPLDPALGPALKA